MAAVASLTRLRVEGMTCQNCARHVTEACQGVPGVRSATVSLTAQHADVRWNSTAEVKVAAVIAAITRAGYDAREIPAAAPGGTGLGESRVAQWQLRLWLGVGVTAILMAGDWGFQLMNAPWFRWLSFGLAGVVQGWCGAPFYRGAWRQLRVGGSNMDTLVSLGSTTAFGFSCWELFTGVGTEHLFFMEAAAIISLISLGHWLEARVGERASGALRELLTLAPPTARRLSGARPPGVPPKFSPRDLLRFKPAAALPETEVETPVAELQAGDLIVLKPGDHVPTDGVVTTGESAVDEAMLTGESAPVDKKPGVELYAGTVNLNGRLVMRVTATGEATALARVIAAVQRAQTSRASIQRLGDRVSNVFVPVVVLVAVATALWWGLAFESARHFHEALAPFLWHTHPPAPAAAAFMVAAAVLIIACPCAMGLATPAAIMAAANAAARRGILIRDGIALEKAGLVTAVLFDKTGTLTQGKPVVARFVAFSPAQATGQAEIKDQALGVNLADPTARQAGSLCHSASAEPDKTVAGLAAALARNSTHPVSQAIARAAEAATGSPPPRLTDWREIRGSGVQAAWNESPDGAVIVRLGSLSWLRESGVDLAAGEAFIAEWSAQGATLAGLAADGTLRGLFAVQDTLKAGAAKVIAQLQSQGLKTYLVTGDNPLTAAGIARQTGIPSENVFAGIRPEQKAELVKQLQGRGERVAFVGDGINDAPALTQADLGIAVCRASDIAREAADLVLLKSEMEAVPEALGLARATLRIIKQNLFWAFFYNALGVPLAAAGFASPVICAAAMGCSDLILIGNTLRLLKR